MKNGLVAQATFGHKNPVLKEAASIMLKTVQKCGDVLGLFTHSRSEWGVTEVSRKLGLSKSSAHAFLSSLTAIGLIRKMSTGRYRLGWRINTLNGLLLGTTTCREHGRQAMSSLQARFGEVTHLGVLDGATVLFLDKLASTHAVHIAGAEVGDRKPAATMSIGKALLSCQPWEDVERALREFRETIGPPVDGILRPAIDVDHDALRIALREVRAEGCAFFLSPDFCAVGAPIWDHTNSVAAAISLSAPTQRFQANKARYVRAIREATDWVSEQLGAPGSPQRRWAEIRQREDQRPKSGS
jgi:DNA-binding IclR family transcriptional regulator